MTKAIKAVSVLCAFICACVLNLGAAYAEDSFASSNVSPQKRVFAVYNDDDSLLSAPLSSTGDNPTYLYGNGDFCSPSLMPIYYFTLKSIGGKVPKGKFLKKVYFALYDTNPDNSSGDTGIRLYAHKVIDDISECTANAKYSNGEGPAYIDEPFAESCINNEQATDVGRHDYFIDITPLYLEAASDESAGMSFAVSCNVGNSDISAKASPADCLKMQAGRVYVLYGDDEPEAEYAPRITDIRFSESAVSPCGEFEASASADGCGYEISSFYFKAASQKFDAVYDEDSGLYRAMITAPAEEGEYYVEAAAVSQNGTIGTARSTEVFSVLNTDAEISADLPPVAPIGSDLSFNLSVTDDDGIASICIKENGDEILSESEINSSVYEASVIVEGDRMTAGRHTIEITVVDSCRKETGSSFEFETAYADVSLIALNENLLSGEKSEATVYVKNIYASNKSYILIYALYDENNSLVAVGTDGGNFAADEAKKLIADFTFPSEADASGMRAELFLWEGSGAFTPIYTAENN